MQPHFGLTFTGERGNDLTFESLGVRRVELIDSGSLPFAPGDATAGTENELRPKSASRTRRSGREYRRKFNIKFP